MRIKTVLLLLTILLVGLADNSAKPCAGAIISDGQSVNGKYRIDVEPQGMTFAERILVWEELGKAQYRIRSNELKLKQPYHARAFIPPNGTFFLLFCPYPGNPFFACYKKTGELIWSVGVNKILKNDEIVHYKGRGRCTAEGACTNNDYKLDEDPQLSKDGWSVSFKTCSGRSVQLLLPFGVVLGLSSVQYEKTLAWIVSLTKEKIKSECDDIAKLIKQLDDDDLKVRDEATQSLINKGFLAILPLENVLKNCSSEEVRARAHAILMELEPWKELGGTKVSYDLRVLSTLAFYPKEDISKGAKERLSELLPIKSGSMTADEIQGWIEKNQEKLKWDESKQKYLFQDK